MYQNQSVWFDVVVLVVYNDQMKWYTIRLANDIEFGKIKVRKQSETGRESDWENEQRKKKKKWK